jgi:hypothetical protein
LGSAASTGLARRHAICSKKSIKDVGILICQTRLELLGSPTNPVAELRAPFEHGLKLRDQPRKIQFFDRLTESLPSDLRKQRVVLFGVSGA